MAVMLHPSIDSLCEGKETVLSGLATWTDSRTLVERGAALRPRESTLISTTATLSCFITRTPTSVGAVPPKLMEIRLRLALGKLAKPCD